MFFLIAYLIVVLSVTLYLFEPYLKSREATAEHLLGCFMLGLIWPLRAAIDVAQFTRDVLRRLWSGK